MQWGNRAVIQSFKNLRALYKLKQSIDRLSDEARTMIDGVCTLSEKTVRDVMVPRIDVVSLSLSSSRQELIHTIAVSGHSRFPVYTERIDNVVGTLYAKDILSRLEEDSILIEQVIRKPFFVPESKRLDALLREMQRRHIHMAVAVDEYGGVSGIICLEDIIEEIVGEIQDEFDNEEEDIIKIGEAVYLCASRVNIEDLNNLLDVNIPNDDFGTLGGFAFELFGKIPSKFEKSSYENLELIIQEMEGRKIKKVKIIKKIPDNTENHEA